MMPFRMPVAASADAATYEHLLILKKNAAVEIVAGLEGYLKARFESPRRERNAAKTAAIEQLSSGLFSWLTLDIDATLEHLKRPPSPQMLYKPSVEELASATERLQTLEAQAEQIRSLIDKAPDEAKAMMSFGLSMIDSQAAEARGYRDRLQQALESAEQAEKEQQNG